MTEKECISGLIYKRIPFWTKMGTEEKAKKLYNHMGSTNNPNGSTTKVLV